MSSDPQCAGGRDERDGDTATALIASRRVVLGSDGALETTPACLQVVAPWITAVHRLDADRYSAQLAELADRHGAVLHDYGEQLVTPAFINAHTHLALGFLRGFDMRAAYRRNLVEDFFFATERLMSPADIRAFAVMGAYDSLLCGVGLVWDHYYAAEQVAEALLEVGLSGVVAPTLQDLSGPGKDSFEQQLAATTALDESAKLRGGGVFAAVGPHATDTVSERLMTAAVEMAEQRQLPLHAHVAQSLEELERVRARHGLTPIAWLKQIGVLDRAPATVLAHCIYAARSDLAALADGRHRLVWCPYSALVFGFPARVGVWSELDVDWVVATDCASNNDTMNVQQELRFVAAQRTVAASWSRSYNELLDGHGDVVDRARAAWHERAELLDEHEALSAPEALLRRVWSAPGAMHPGFRAGELAAGALANILVWDLDHPALWPAIDPLHCLTMSDATAAIWAMFVAGRRVGSDGDFHRSVRQSPGYADARREANARLKAILSKIAAS